MALADFVVCAAKVLAQRRQVGSCQHCASTPTGQKGKWLRATVYHSIVYDYGNIIMELPGPKAQSQNKTKANSHTIAWHFK